MGLHEKKKVFQLKIDSAMFDVIPLQIESIPNGKTHQLLVSGGQ